MAFSVLKGAKFRWLLKLERNGIFVSISLSHIMILVKLLSYMPMYPPLRFEFCGKRIFSKQPAEVFANILGDRTPYLRYFLNPPVKIQSCNPKPSYSRKL